MKFQKIQIDFELIDDQVFADGKPIDLSAKGHSCLMLFMQSNQQTLTKEFLIKSLWDHVYVSDDSLFKVIQEVRKSLRNLGIKQDMIGNVYGKGYQWLPGREELSESHHVIRWVAIILAVFLITSLIYGFSTFSAYAPMDEAEFIRLKNIIVKGENIETNEWKQLVETSLHPLDQLRLAYLQGYQMYQQGSYDESITLLTTGIDAYGDNEVKNVQADAYLLLSKMFIYREDKKSLKNYLDEAQNRYQTLNNYKGWMDARIERARYHQAIYEYQDSITQLTNIIEEAENRNDIKSQMRAWSNLAFSYEQTQQPLAAIDALEQSLNMALSLGDGNYAAFAYGDLSKAALNNNQPQKAMKYALAAMQFVLSQHNTNIFQQGFSAFYLLLLPLGHQEMARLYLNQAIDLQNHFNEEGVLYLAEYQLAELDALNQRYTASRQRLDRLMDDSMDNSSLQDLDALYAYNSHFLQDNINAYTRAQLILESDDSSRRAKLYAGMAMVLSADHLERQDEAMTAYENLAEQINQNDGAAYVAYLAMLNEIPEAWIDKDERQKKQADFKLHSAHLKAITEPEAELLQAIDLYIKNIIEE